jgi:hypothetical protein
MIAIALILSAQPVPQSMLATADSANGAYVQCLFATARAANGAHLSVDAFEGELASACRSEEQAIVRATTAVLDRRGERNAEATARQLAQDSRRSVLETYRKTIEFRQ